MTQETWHPITEPANCAGWYEVSNLGRIRSVARALQIPGAIGRPRMDGRVLAPRPNGKGQIRATLCGADGARHDVLVHRLVARAFVPNPEDLPSVEHKDGNRSNNAASNLRWRPKTLKLDAAAVRAIRQARRDGWTFERIAERFGISDSMVDHILGGRAWCGAHD